MEIQVASLEFLLYTCCKFILQTYFSTPLKATSPARMGLALNLSGIKQEIELPGLFVVCDSRGDSRDCLPSKTQHIVLNPQFLVRLLNQRVFSLSGDPFNVKLQGQIAFQSLEPIQDVQRSHCADHDKPLIKLVLGRRRDSHTELCSRTLYHNQGRAKGLMLFVWGCVLCGESNQ